MKTKVVFRKIHYFFVLLLVSRLISCKTWTKSSLSSSDQKSVHLTHVNTIKLDEPEIFFKNNIEIEQELNALLMGHPELYQSFINHSIIFDLYCDTLECSILSIEIDDDAGFVEISQELLGYFNRYNTVNCFHTHKKVKISHFNLLIFAQPNNLKFSVDYGYKVE